MNEQRLKIIKKFINAYNTFDIDEMLDLLHPEIRFRNITNGEVTNETTGKKEFEDLARQSASLFSEREQKITGHNAAEEIIMVEIDYHAVLAEDLPNGMKKGDKIDMKGRSEYTIKDGLIYSITDEA